MGKKMETAIKSYIGTTIRINSLKKVELRPFGLFLGV